MSEERIPFGKTAGPLRIEPVRPRPYMSCETCIHLHKTVAHSGEGTHGPTWHKTCHHVEMVVNKTMCLNENTDGDTDSEARTPPCCPYLKDEK
jgi:hypothetical protein